MEQELSIRDLQAQIAKDREELEITREILLALQLENLEDAAQPAEENHNGTTV